LKIFLNFALVLSASWRIVRMTATIIVILNLSRHNGIRIGRDPESKTDSDFRQNDNDCHLSVGGQIRQNDSYVQPAAMKQ
jgi:hypothetical protein